MNIINQSLAVYVGGRLWVLRRKRDKFPLNVSYTVDGLKWTTNKMGKALFFKDGIISKGRITGNDLSMSDDVYVEPFHPIEHFDLGIRRAELRCLDKALRMCY